MSGGYETEWILCIVNLNKEEITAEIETARSLKQTATTTVQHKLSV